MFVSWYCCRLECCIVVLCGRVSCFHRKTYLFGLHSLSLRWEVWFDNRFFRLEVGCVSKYFKDFGCQAFLQIIHRASRKSWREIQAPSRWGKNLQSECLSIWANRPRPYSRVNTLQIWIQNRFRKDFVYIKVWTQISRMIQRRIIQLCHATAPFNPDYYFFNGSPRL